MCRVKARLIVLPLVAALLLTSVAAGAGEPRPKLARVVYITTSKACRCTLERCRTGDEVIRQVFIGPRERLLERIDVAEDKEAAAAYMKQYPVGLLPALLMLDAAGKLLWRAVGHLDREEIANKLSHFGG